MKFDGQIILKKIIPLTIKEILVNHFEIDALQPEEALTYKNCHLKK